jgi:hypothetical protein
VRHVVFQVERGREVDLDLAIGQAEPDRRGILEVLGRVRILARRGGLGGVSGEDLPEDGRDALMWQA